MIRDHFIQPGNRRRPLRPTIAASDAPPARDLADGAAPQGADLTPGPPPGHDFAALQITAAGSEEAPPYRPGWSLRGTYRLATLCCRTSGG